MKLIAVLRDPVDRAYSHYQMQVRMGHETRCFDMALGREADLARYCDGQPAYSTIANRYTYVANGRLPSSRALARVLPHEQRSCSDRGAQRGSGR
jgi:hypothetical protein